MAVYETAHPPKTPAAAIGQQIDTGRWFVTVRSARTATTPPTGVAPTEPKQLVLVDLDVVNRSATPNNILGRVFTLTTQGAELQPPTAYLDRDQYFAGYFNPDMPERVTLAWEWPPDTPVPDRLR